MKASEAVVEALICFESEVVGVDARCACADEFDSSSCSRATFSRTILRTSVRLQRVVDMEVAVND